MSVSPEARVLKHPLNIYHSQASKHEKAFKFSQNVVIEKHILKKIVVILAEAVTSIYLFILLE